LRSAEAYDVPITLLGRGALGVSSCVGVVCELSTLEVRVDERGVTLPAASAPLTGVLSCCLTLGVTLGGSD